MVTRVKLVMPMNSRSNGISYCNDWMKGEGVCNLPMKGKKAK